PLQSCQRRRARDATADAAARTRWGQAEVDVERRGAGADTNGCSGDTAATGRARDAVVEAIREPRRIERPNVVVAGREAERRVVARPIGLDAADQRAGADGENLNGDVGQRRAAARGGDGAADAAAVGQREVDRRERRSGGNDNVGRAGTEPAGTRDAVVGLLD